MEEPYIRTTISAALHQSGLYGSDQTEATPQSKGTWQPTWSLPKGNLKTQDSLVWWNQDWTLWPECQAWWWQHHDEGIFFSGRDWETSQDRGKDERSKVQRSLMKTYSRALRTSDWRDGSPSNRTTTLSTQPRQCRSGFRTSLWMPLSGPARAGLEHDLTSLERPENSCAATLPIQPDRDWEDLQRRMEETPQIQVCQACIVIPKKTWGCSRCQRVNKVLTKRSENLRKCDISVCFISPYFFLNNCFCIVILGYSV
jgi:hypothetical protein